MKRPLFGMAAAAAAFVNLLVTAQAQPNFQREPHVAGELIIQFELAVTDGEIAEAFRRGGLHLIEHVRTSAMKNQGKIGLTRVTTAMPLPVAIEVLNKLPGIEFAELHWNAEPDVVADDPLYMGGSLWGLYGDDLPFPGTGPAGTTNPYGSQAEKAWAAGFVGWPEIYVGIIDTGIQTDHPDLGANIWINPGEVPNNGIDDDGNGYVDDIHGWNAEGNNGDVFELMDDDSHGTHLAGTIGATAGNGIGVAGMNWDVKMISGKFMGAGTFSILNAIEAIDYMIALKTEKGLNIVALNNSWHTGFSLALQDAYTRAAQVGILAICAANNSALNNDSFPSSPSCLDTTAAAGYDAIVSVAAIDAGGSKAGFSSYGSYSVDLGAPGVDILSTVPDAEPPNGYPGGYKFGNGTSYAASHVTGAIALFASIYPTATAAEIKNRLLTVGVVDTPSLNGITLTGGRLDIYAFITGPASTTTPPVPASGLTAAAGSKGTIKLAWKNVATNEKGFAIERKSVSNGSWQTIASVRANTLTFSNSSLASRTTYSYRIRSFNAAGSSAYSNEATAKTK